MFDTFFPMPSDTVSQDLSDNTFQVTLEDSRKKYVCSYPSCGKYFRYKSEIVRHTATHSESRPFNCPYDNCSKAFKRHDALENHIRSSHTRETPFACPVPGCDAKFTTHGSFRYHVLKHNKQTADEGTPIESKETVYDPAQPRKQVKPDSPIDEGLTSSPSETFDFGLKPSKKEQKDLSDEFLAPPPRFASKIKWEMMNDDEAECSSPSVNTNESANYKEERDQLAKENQCLKQKLETSEKVVKNMQRQIDDLLNNLYACQTQLSTTNYGYQNPPFQTVGLDSRLKSEDVLLDMINYEDANKDVKNNYDSPSRGIYNETNSFDNIFSFDQDLPSFNF